MIRELDRVVLTEALPDLSLEAGDIGTVVLIHENGAGFEVEFVTLTGETLAVTTLTNSQVRPIRRGEVASARVFVAWYRASGQQWEHSPSALGTGESGA
jgi:hypothetical protein